MRLVNLATVRPGEKLSYAIRTQNGGILLPANTVLTDKHIQRIKSFGIYAIYIQDDIFDEVSACPCLSDETKTEILCAVEAIYKATDTKKPIKSEPVRKAVKNAINDVKYAMRTQPVGLFNTFAVKDVRCLHAVNVATVTATLAIEHGCEPQIVEDYVMAAIFHDMYLSHMDKDDDPKHAETAKEYLKFVREYSIRTYMSVGMHHERFDGKGANRIAGERIAEGARIIAVADAYDNLLHGYGGYKVTPQNYALEQINNMAGVQLDPTFLGYFNSSVAIYPVGATVILNNNYKAVVVAQNYKMPGRPKVRLSMPDKVDCIEINLLTNLTTFIEKIV